jgi:hypothetical protein
LLNANACDPVQSRHNRGVSLPPDPFESQVPEFENFTGPHADEIRSLIRTFADAKADFGALVTQPSFRELGIAVNALDDERARAALLRAVASYRAHLMDDGEEFAQWVERQE